MTVSARTLGDMAVDFLDAILDVTPDQEAIGTYAAQHEFDNCDFYFLGNVCEELEPGARYFAPESAEETKEIFWPIDFAIAAEQDYGMCLTHIRTANSSEVRGKVRIVPPKMIWVTTSWIGGENNSRLERYPMGLLAKQWCYLDSEQIVSRKNNNNLIVHRIYDELPSLRDAIGMIFSVRLTYRYEWHVAIGRSCDGARLIFPTNPRGCLELFKLRDRVGDGRRGALKHWVNEHYRQRSIDPTELDYVREHLRGCSRFTWDGLACELMVSEFDLEKNEYYRVRTAEWRALRKHNRPSVKLRSVKRKRTA